MNLIGTMPINLLLFWIIVKWLIELDTNREICQSTWAASSVLNNMFCGFRNPLLFAMKWWMHIDLVFMDRTVAELQQNMSRNIYARLCIMLFCTNVQCLGVWDVLSWYYQGSCFNIAIRVSTRSGSGRCYLTDLSSLSILYHPRNEVVGVYIGFTPSVLPPVRPPIGLTCSVTPTVPDGFSPY